MRHKEQQEQHEQQVIAAVEAMTAAFHRGDIDGVMACYESEATIVFEPGQATRDPATQRRQFIEFFALSPQFRYGGHEAFVTGDTAVHIAPWTMTGTAPDGAAFEQSGLSVAVLRRQPDGRWLMVIDDPHGSHLERRPEQ